MIFRAPEFSLLSDGTDDSYESVSVLVEIIGDEISPSFADNVLLFSLPGFLYYSYVLVPAVHHRPALPEWGLSRPSHQAAEPPHDSS